MAQFRDVVIVGGGLVGSTMACALASSPLARAMSITLVDSISKSAVSKGSHIYPHPETPSPSLRVSAISPASTRLFQALNVWDKLTQTKRVTSVDSMHVWDASGGAGISFDSRSIQKQSDEFKDQSLAYMIEDDLICHQMYRTLEELNNPSLEMRFGRSVTNVDFSHLKIKDSSMDSYFSPDLVGVELDDGTKINTRLLIAADGADSCLRKQLTKKEYDLVKEGPARVVLNQYTSDMMGEWGWSYQQRAVVCSLKLSQLPNSMVWNNETNTYHSQAFQVFLPTGPLAVLPMHENYASLAWTTTPDHANQLLKLEDKAFVNEINNHLQHRLKLGGGTLGKALQSVLFKNRPSSSRFSKKRPHRFLVDNGITVPLVESIEGSRTSYPLRLLHAAEYVRPRFALIGDAAHVVHPMAGQGVNMGFADVTSLANTVIHSLESGLDIGDIRMLLQYQEQRKADNLFTQMGVDALRFLFDSNSLPVIAARTLGIDLSNRLEPIKNLWAELAVQKHVNVSSLGPQGSVPRSK